MLTLGGKEVLVKSVAQAIRTYAMSIFKIPKKKWKGITYAVSRFWWGDDATHKRPHWFAWWMMCIPNKEGGVGFRISTILILLSWLNRLGGSLTTQNHMCLDP